MSQMVKRSDIKNVVTLEAAITNDQPLVISFEPDGYTEDGYIFFSHLVLEQLMEAFQNLKHVNPHGKNKNYRGVVFMLRSTPYVKPESETVVVDAE